LLAALEPVILKFARKRTRHSQICSQIWESHLLKQDPRAKARG